MIGWLWNGLVEAADDVGKFAYRNLIPSSNSISTGVGMGLGLAAGGVLVGAAVSLGTKAVEAAWEAIPETRDWVARQIAADPDHVAQEARNIASQRMAQQAVPQAANNA